MVALRPVPNLNTERGHDRYEMDPKALLAVEREAKAGGMSVMGVYHSHPDNPARPSATDLERAWPGYAYVIVSVRQGRAAEWGCWCLDEKEKKFKPAVIRLEDPAA